MKVSYFNPEEDRAERKKDEEKRDLTKNEPKWHTLFVIFSVFNLIFDVIFFSKLLFGFLRGPRIEGISDDCFGSCPDMIVNALFVLLLIPTVVVNIIGLTILFTKKIKGNTRIFYLLSIFLRYAVLLCFILVGLITATTG